jgi:hypothetical protein
MCVSPISTVARASSFRGRIERASQIRPQRHEVMCRCVPRSWTSCHPLASPSPPPSSALAAAGPPITAHPRGPRPGAGGAKPTPCPSAHPPIQRPLACEDRAANAQACEIVHPVTPIEPPRDPTQWHAPSASPDATPGVPFIHPTRSSSPCATLPSDGL